MERKRSIYSYLLCALFAALTAICSQIFVPLPFTPVPVNLALLAVLICGGALGVKRGGLAMLIYVLLGAFGAPVFAGLKGGLGALAGPTGGYIIGYIPAAIIMALLVTRFTETGKRAETDARTEEKTRGLGAIKNLGATIAIGVPAVAACYALGTAWFMISTGRGIMESLVMCVIPFIPADILKIICASAVCEALRRPMRALARTQGFRV